MCVYILEKICKEETFGIYIYIYIYTSFHKGKPLELVIKLNRNLFLFFLTSSSILFVDVIFLTK